MGIRELVNGALDAAGDLAEGVTDVALGAVNGVTALYKETYDTFVASGMSPSDAADKAEIACRNYLRDSYGITVL